MISDVIDKVLVEVKSIDKLCAPSKDAAEDLSAILKSLYDSSVQISRKKIGPLDRLVVAGLDDETIWEEIQTRNKPLLRYLTKIVTRLKKRVEAAMERSDDDEEEGDEEEMEVVEDDEDEDDAELEDAPSGEENSEDEAAGMDSEDDEGDFDETKEDFVESGSEEGDDGDDGDDDGDDGDSEGDMEAWLDREDELEMDREEREERRARKADKKKVKFLSMNAVLFAMFTLIFVSCRALARTTRTTRSWRRTMSWPSCSSTCTREGRTPTTKPATRSTNSMIFSWRISPSAD